MYKYVKSILVLGLLLNFSGCIYGNSSTINSSISSNSTSSSKISSDLSSIVSNFSSSTGEKKEYRTTSYVNPIYSNGEYADPTGVYCEEDNTYYLFTTGGKILKSKNMVTWTRINDAFYSIPSWGTPGAGLWAPDVQYINGQYVMYYSLSTWGDSNPGIGVATAKHPKGPWVDQGELFRSLDIGVNNSIDPMTFVDKTGKVYIVWGSMRGNYIVELTSDGLNLKNGIEYANKYKYRVAGLDTSYEWDVETYEGAYIIYENDYYYLFLSMGTCCAGLNSTYKVVVGRSKNIYGPYLDDKGVDLRNRSAGKVVLDKGDYFVGSGHHCFLKDAMGEYFMYYHTYSQDKTNYRILAMDHMYFDENGWPCIKDNKASRTEQTGPTTYIIEG